MNDDTKIIIEKEQLPSVEQPQQADKIVIDLEDLPPDPPQQKIYPKLSEDHYQPLVMRKGKGLAKSNLMQNLVSGLIGGFLAWLVTEVLLGNDTGNIESYAQVILHSALFFGVVGGLIGIIMGAAEGASTYNSPKAVKDGAVGLAFGFGGGLLGGAIGQLVYSLLGDGTGVSIGLQVLVRSLGWGLLGLLIGLGQGVQYRSGKKVINGLNLVNGQHYLLLLFKKCYCAAGELPESHLIGHRDIDQSKPGRMHPGLDK